MVSLDNEASKSKSSPLENGHSVESGKFSQTYAEFFSDFVGVIWGQQLAILLGKWLHFVSQRSCRIGTCLNIRLILFKHLFFLFLLNQSWWCHTVTFAMLLLLLFLLLYITSFSYEVVIDFIFVQKTFAYQSLTLLESVVDTVLKVVRNFFCQVCAAG